MRSETGKLISRNERRTVGIRRSKKVAGEPEEDGRPSARAKVKAEAANESSRPRGEGSG